MLDTAKLVKKSKCEALDLALDVIEKLIKEDGPGVQTNPHQEFKLAIYRLKNRINGGGDFS